MREQWADEMILVPKTGEQRDIDITSHSRLAPPLNGNSTYEAGVPSARVTEILQLESRLEDRDHLRSLARWRCISTNPEDSPGGSIRGARSNGGGSNCSDNRLASSATSRKRIRSNSGPASFQVWAQRRFVSSTVILNYRLQAAPDSCPAYSLGL